MNQKESEEESENENVDKKEKFEEGRLNHSFGAMFQQNKIQNHFSSYKEKSHFVPYFEVFGPPPELV